MGRFLEFKVYYLNWTIHRLYQKVPGLIQNIKTFLNNERGFGKFQRYNFFWGSLKRPLQTLNMELGSDKAAIALLCRAVELDSKKRKSEALVCYKEGLQLLINVITELKKGVGANENKQKLKAYQTKASEYMNRTEQLSLEIKNETRAGEFHEQIKIEEGSTGNSYSSLLFKFMDKDVVQV